MRIWNRTGALLLEALSPNPNFKPFEIENLDHFGFYETYSTATIGTNGLYAMKFDSYKPIVFALSARICSTAIDRPCVMASLLEQSP